MGCCCFLARLRAARLLAAPFLSLSLSHDRSSRPRHSFSLSGTRLFAVVTTQRPFSSFVRGTYREDQQCSRRKHSLAPPVGDWQAGWWPWLCIAFLGVRALLCHLSQPIMSSTRDQHIDNTVGILVGPPPCCQRGGEDQESWRGRRVDEEKGSFMSFSTLLRLHTEMA
jgi:hypothetical protein